MVHVTRIAEADVLHKIDAPFIVSKFSNLEKKVVIVFVCTNETWRKEEAWKYKGETYYAIRLPYEQVKALDDARPLMLELVAKRLGVPVPLENRPVSGIAI